MLNVVQIQKIILVIAQTNFGFGHGNLVAENKIGITGSKLIKDGFGQADKLRSVKKPPGDPVFWSDLFPDQRDRVP